MSTSLGSSFKSKSLYSLHPNFLQSLQRSWNPHLDIASLLYAHHFRKNL